MKEEPTVSFTRDNQSLFIEHITSRELRTQTRSQIGNAIKRHFVSFWRSHFSHLKDSFHGLKSNKSELSLPFGIPKAAAFCDRSSQHD